MGRGIEQERRRGKALGKGGRFNKRGVVGIDLSKTPEGLGSTASQENCGPDPDALVNELRQLEYFGKRTQHIRTRR